MGLSVGFAFAEIRKRAYELFKATHIVLAVITLAAFYEYVPPGLPVSCCHYPVANLILQAYQISICRSIQSMGLGLHCRMGI